MCFPLEVMPRAMLTPAAGCIKLQRRMLARKRKQQPKLPFSRNRPIA
jgi:hypothetical protein